jgi:hypothetical protein
MVSSNYLFLSITGNANAAANSGGLLVRSQLLFVLAWFHAVLQERRTYIPQGFTKFYEFSFADLRSSADIIDNLCRKLGLANVNLSTLPWPTIRGLLEQVEICLFVLNLMFPFSFFHVSSALRSSTKFNHYIQIQSLHSVIEFNNYNH